MSPSSSGRGTEVWVSERMRIRVLMVGESGDGDGLGGIAMIESMRMMSS